MHWSSIYAGIYSHINYNKLVMSLVLFPNRLAIVLSLINIPNSGPVVKENLLVVTLNSYESIYFTNHSARMVRNWVVGDYLLSAARYVKTCV